MLQNIELLEELVSIPGTSGDESAIQAFLLDYVQNKQMNWKVQPKILHGKEFQDTVVLVFGQPTTAIFSHIDTIGFTCAYENNLVKIGGPRTIEGMLLVGEDALGKIETELMPIEDETGHITLKCVYDREIERGTPLSFKPHFRLDDTFVQSPYMDNRLGVWVALQVAQNLENGILVFSTYEEVGGNSAGFIADYIYRYYGVRQALIADITWVTEGVRHGEGVAISLRDSSIPRRKFVKRIVELAKQSGIQFQLEVESAGGSDGTTLQKSSLPFDWCFIGAPEDNVHSPDEKVALSDIQSMIDLYTFLMKEM
jgi:putative aminopeptidase FrvX